MIDIVDISFAVTQFEHVLQRVNQVFAAQRHLVFTDVLVELAVNTEATNPAQPIAVVVEELLFKQRLGFVNLRRIARAKPRVNLKQRRLMRLGGVFGECVKNERVAHLRHHFHRLEAARLDLFKLICQLSAGFDNFFTRIAVDNRRSGVVLRLQVFQLDVFDLIELTNDCFTGAVLFVQRANKRGCRNLAALVDAHGKRILLSNRTLDPRPTLGNDAEAVQRTVAFLHFDEKIHARRSVQLVDDYALGTVDDELATADHDRDFAEVDAVFHHLVFIFARELHTDAKRHAESKPKCPAFVGGVAGFEQLVADIIQPEVAVVAFNRKNFAKQSFQAFGLALGWLGVLLQKAIVSRPLDFDEIGDGQRVAALGEVAYFVNLNSHRDSFLAVLKPQ